MRRGHGNDGDRGVAIGGTRWVRVSEQKSSAFCVAGATQVRGEGNGLGFPCLGQALEFGIRWISVRSAARRQGNCEYEQRKTFCCV